jgi:UDP-2,3-diacylglucosamine pyrophosphatase LpxH
MDKFLILSDLHLDLENKITDEILHNYLQTALNENYIIILNGDIIDIIKNELINFQREYDRIKQKYRNTIELLSNERIIYIKGNHDAVLKRLNIHSNIRNEYDIIYDNYEIHIEHGSQYDLPNGKCHCIGDLIARCWSCCNPRILLSEDFVDHLEDVEEKTSHKKLKKHIFNYDLTIFGHTHMSYLKTNHLNKIYLNTGSLNKNIIN